MNSENVLVTGADGFVGIHLTKALLNRGARVTVLIHRSDEQLIKYNLLDRVRVVYGSVTDYNLLVRVLNEHEINLVFHLAAQTQVGSANQSPIPTFETNILGTWNVLEAVRINNARCIIASTDKAYGEQDTLPITEEMPLRGNHPYDASKNCADRLAQSYAHSFGVNVTIARPSNVYGPGDTNTKRIVPGMIQTLLAGTQPLIRSDGKSVRDYLYVEDVARGYLQLADAMLTKNIAGEAFNFSTGTPVTVLEMVQAIQTELKTSLAPIIQNSAVNEIKEQYLDNTKARNLLNWKPTHTLTQGMQKTIAWYTQKHF